MTWVKERKREYAAGKRQLEQYRDKLLTVDPEEVAEELTIVEGMIADMNYSLEWMRTGRQPNTRRGVDIKDAYKRSILMDMDLMPTPEPEEEITITITQKQAAVRILMKLSPRELECYLLNMSNGLSERAIAKELKLSRTTVQKNIQRAKSKVLQEV
ncbi:sigma factor-like helix-turn-helix DNA-binding protein [Cohnella luojiensis]|uniref:Fis family transcriptional regulator n=1 Tax=Cohnella luojiensis TaxID=652876 RepID=A0A4Y8M5R1_9BACL|nr:sigma factor-like helix-turn-helix DNA-binding protein [Cohnella luojiensis]TFE30822.1 Fis family transcriptional regulator [Cohnella luojiensis]